ncbi:MAG: hypothetical protein V1800_10650 [Candidatus Latescibacterota bacterium]
MRRFERSKRLLLVGSMLVVALFSDGLLTFAQQRAEPELMWEMRFEEGKPQVVRNEVARLKREGKAEKFPLKAMANQKEKKVVWFDEEGKVREEKAFEDAKRLLVSRDGKFFGVARREFHEGSFELEYFDEQGRSLWKEWIGDVIYMSPTGETVVGGDIMYGEHLTFVDSQGAVRKYEDFGGGFRPVFSADGRYVFCSIYQKDNRSVALFDSKGNMLWKRYDAPINQLFFNDVAIASDGKYIAVARRVDRMSRTTYYVSVLDIAGNILWEKPSERVYDLEFSEDGKQIAVLKKTKNKQVKAIWILRAADGKEVTAFQAASPQDMRHLRYHLYLLNGGKCLFGIYGKSKDGSRIFDLRLHDSKGEQLWDVSLPVDVSEDVGLISYGKAIAVKLGSSSKVFMFSGIDQ